MRLCFPRFGGRYPSLGDFLPELYASSHESYEHRRRNANRARNDKAAGSHSSQPDAAADARFQRRRALQLFHFGPTEQECVRLRIMIDQSPPQPWTVGRVTGEDPFIVFRTK